VVFNKTGVEAVGEGEFVQSRVRECDGGFYLATTRRQNKKACRNENRPRCAGFVEDSGQPAPKGSADLCHARRNPFGVSFRGAVDDEESRSAFAFQGEIPRCARNDTAEEGISATCQVSATNVKHTFYH
jgi:hypothetical protein